MNCPNCTSTNLVLSERRGVEIDYCPNCRGIWLDRGELDKILEQSVNERAREVVRESAAPLPDHDYQYRDRDGYKYKRKKSFLEELFD